MAHPAGDDRITAASKAARGGAGERLAAEHLEKHGWTILERNFRFGHGEVDLIARRGRIVAFVEVKVRTGAEFGHPLEAIGLAKQREIRRVADYWIAHRGDPLDLYRFDAVAITTHGGNQLIEHVEDAWGI
jgi:putative endonuclease